MKPNLQREIVLPRGVTAQLQRQGTAAFVLIKGPQGEVPREITHPSLQVSVEGNRIVLSSKKKTRREKMLLGSLAAHLRNAVQGVQQLHQYKLKVCSGHFPMTVSIVGNEFILKNFLGESVPRKVSLVPGATVKVNGQEVLVSSPDKEKAGLMAERIEQLCRITNRDLRIFMDGIWITEKAGKAV